MDDGKVAAIAQVGNKLVSDLLHLDLPARFVTAGLARYVSGHSTFGRGTRPKSWWRSPATPTSPAGSSQYTLPRSELLHHEEGPDTGHHACSGRVLRRRRPGGLSRIYMGIHILRRRLHRSPDGSTCGLEAWALAQRYFDGTAR